MRVHPIDRAYHKRHWGATPSPNVGNALSHAASTRRAWMLPRLVRAPTSHDNAVDTPAAGTRHKEFGQHRYRHSQEVDHATSRLGLGVGAKAMQAAGDSIEHRIVCQLQGNPAAPPPEFQLEPLKPQDRRKRRCGHGSKTALVSRHDLGRLTFRKRSFTSLKYGAPLIRVALVFRGPLRSTTLRSIVRLWAIHSDLLKLGLPHSMDLSQRKRTRRPQGGEECAAVTKMPAQPGHDFRRLGVATD